MSKLRFWMSKGLSTYFCITNILDFTRTCFLRGEGDCLSADPLGSIEFFWETSDGKTGLTRLSLCYWVSRISFNGIGLVPRSAYSSIKLNSYWSVLNTITPLPLLKLPGFRNHRFSPVCMVSLSWRLPNTLLFSTKLGWLYKAEFTSAKESCLPLSMTLWTFTKSLSWFYYWQLKSTTKVKGIKSKMSWCRISACFFIFK